MHPRVQAMDHHPDAHHDREALDHALFGCEKSFDPADLPVFLPPVPEVEVPEISISRSMPLSCVVPHLMPATREDYSVPDYPVPLPEFPSDSPSGAAVSDSSGSYELANLSPGVYEVRPPEPVSPSSLLPVESLLEPSAEKVVGEDESGSDFTNPNSAEGTWVETEVVHTESEEPQQPLPAPVQPNVENMPTVEAELARHAGAEGESDVSPLGDVREKASVAGTGCEGEEGEVSAHESTAPLPEEDAGQATIPEVVAARVLRLETNAGLQIAPGETVRLGADVLRVVGDDSAFLVDLLLLSPPAEGVLLRDGFALTGGDIFTQEDIDRGRITYRHEGECCASEDAFTFTTPDGDIPATRVDIVVRQRRRAPRLTGCGNLEGIEQGVRVACILDSCVEAEGECGMAVLEANGAGTWSYSCDGGLTWQVMGSIQSSRALLLGPVDLVRFLPFDQARVVGYSTVPRLTYRAWDLSTGLAGQHADCANRLAVGGVTAFSAEVTSASLRLLPKLVQEQRVAEPPWTTELSGEALVGSCIAVVRLDGDGVWQVNPGGESGWTDCGAVYHGRALLLDASDQLRFFPRSGAGGKVTLGLRQWDGSGAVAQDRVNLAQRKSVGPGTPFGQAVQNWSWRLGA